MDFYGLALSLPAVHVTLTSCGGTPLTGAGTQINDASLSVPESYSECRDIFHRSSLAACNSAAVTEGLLCAKCRGRSWRYQSVSHGILAHKELPAS